MIQYDKNKNKDELPVADTPEEVGVSSDKVYEMLCELKDTECHGFMIIRHGKIAAQWFKKPYSAASPHAMYSVSKSISAIAIGFAVCEGLLSLDDKVVDFFPQAVPKKCDDGLKNVTLENLISLTAGRTISPLANRVNNNWLDLFMKSAYDYMPGEKFSYVNECFHVALAMLNKVTGVSTVEFLTPRLFEPLGIKTPFWESEKNGIEAGGWGIFLSPTDLAKIALCFMNDGLHNGKQIIPSKWIKQASTNHKGPYAKVQRGADFGYGYGLWIREGENQPVRFDGLFGQVAEIHKKYDAVTLVVGGDSNCVHREIMFKYFPRSFIEEQPNAVQNEKLINALKNSENKAISARYRSELESSIDGKIIVFKKKRLIDLLNFPLSVIPAAGTYMSKNKAGDITDVRFKFREDSVNFSWREKEEKNSIECGFNGEWKESNMRLTGTPYTSYAVAAWENKNTLLLQILPGECVCSRYLRFTFSKNRVKMEPKSQPPVDSILDGVRGIVKSTLKSERITDLILNLTKKIIEPTHKGHWVKNKT